MKSRVNTITLVQGPKDLYTYCNNAAKQVNLGLSYNVVQLQSSRTCKMKVLRSYSRIY